MSKKINPLLLSFGALLLAVGILYSCKSESTYTLTGTVAKTELEGKQIMLRQMDGERTLVDSTLIIDGKFTFKGAVEEPMFCRLTVSEINPETGRMSNIFHAMLILENAKITLTADAEGKSKITGSKNNDILQAFVDADAVLGKKQDEAWQAAREARAAGDEELAKSFGAEQRKYSEERQEQRIIFVKNNINNPAGRSQLGWLSGLPLEQLKELIANANEATLQNPNVVKLVERIQALEKTAIGQPFTDLRMQDFDGKEIAISDFAGKGKYVMIDFTATWCGPCRVGKPAMIDTYHKYKDKGFEIVGVWFEYTYEDWVKGHKALNLPGWPQMSDLKEWKSEGARLYAINGIPHSVLIDPNGIIIARGLRGEELDKKLAELLTN